MLLVKDTKKDIAGLNRKAKGKSLPSRATGTSYEIMLCIKPLAYFTG